MEGWGPPRRTIMPNEKPNPTTRWTAILLAAVLLGSTGLRLAAVNKPLVGNFSDKNVVHAMSARNWVSGRAPFWYPTLDIMHDGRRSLHMLACPISAYLAGALWSNFGGSLDVWGRLVSTASMAGAAWILFLFVRRRHGVPTALAAAAVLAFAPVGILHGSGFMLQGSLVLFSVAAFWAMDRWLNSGRAGWYALLTVAAALMMLTKVYAGVLLLPLAWPLLFERASETTKRRRVLGLVALALALIPSALWYGHAYRTAAPDHPESARVHYSVRHSGEDHFPPHPLLRNPDYYRQVLDTTCGMVLTPIGFTLAVLAVFHPSIRRYLPWAAAYAVLFLLLPRKFYETDYYYMVVLPLGAVLAGLGWGAIDGAFRTNPRAYRLGTAFVFGVFLLLCLRYAAKPTYGIPEEDRAVVEAGAAGATSCPAGRTGRHPARHGFRPALLLQSAGLGAFIGGRRPEIGPPAIRRPRSEALRRCRP